jgi:molecular chaperone DnaJ
VFYKEDSTLYEILSVSSDATEKEIVTMFRRLAKRYHPDKRRGDDSAFIFRRIWDAKCTLVCSVRRQRYDAELAAKRNETVDAEE